MAKRRRINIPSKLRAKIKGSLNDGGNTNSNIKKVKRNIKKEIEPEEVPEFEWNFGIGDIVMLKNYNTYHIIVGISNGRGYAAGRRVSKSYDIFPTPSGHYHGKRISGRDISHV